jgi:hypothetical protein
MGVWASLYIPQLISRVLKLPTIQTSSDPEVYKTQISDLQETNLEHDQLIYI